MATKSQTKVITQDIEPARTLPPSQQDNVKTELTYTDSEFPPTNEDAKRLANYENFEQLFMGDHFEAFRIKMRDPRYAAWYEKLRYIKANFAGLLSKVMADMLFNEPINIKVEKNQEFVDAFVKENQLNVMLYESALTCSSLGDALFKLRVGPRHPENDREESTVILDSVTPKIYFPEIDPFNVKGDPKRKILAWKFKIDKKEYLRMEIHEYRKIINKVFEMDGKKIGNEVSINILGGIGLLPEVPIEIDECTLIHVANWRLNGYFGISDYYDLEQLFFAINNRFTMVDNILDKHSDPILMVPPGVLDKDGKVNKKALGVIEYEEGTTGEPKYIVWDASLENAFKETEKLIELFFMISETSPDILGMGQGQAESGRALKLKLLRTIAKARRKRLYYDQAIKDIIYRAQLLAVAYRVKVGGKTITEAEYPEIEWADGLPADDMEMAQVEQIRLDSGTTTKKDAIMRLDGVDEKTAEKKAQEIDDETAIEVPVNNTGDGLDGGNMDDKDMMKNKDKNMMGNQNK